MDGFFHEVMNMDSMKPEFIENVKKEASVDSAQQASSGDYAQQASSGNYSKQASSGDYSKQASSGDYTKMENTGEKSITVSCGLNSSGKIGHDGCLVLARWVESEKRYRVSVGYVGENIEANVWYRLDENGKFVKIEG